MKKHLLSVTIYALLSASTISCGDTSPAQMVTPTVDLSVQTYATDASGFAIQNHLISGNTDAVLVDTNLLRADADKLVQMIKSSGKSLKMIWLTHAHPDHYLGLDIVLTAFPGTPVYSTPEVVADYTAVSPGRFAGSKASFGPLIADKLGTIQAYSSDTITLEGETIKVVKLPAGESSVASALYVPRQGLLFSGDAAGGDSHAFLAECRIDQMIANVATLKALGTITKVYGGHGAPGTSLQGLDVDTAYLGDAKNIFGTALTPAEAIGQMSTKYPNLTAGGILGFSTQLYFAGCRPPAVLTGFKAPESAYWHATASGTKYWYVSNISTQTTAGDGSITRISADLKTVEHNWVTNLNNPSGIHSIGDTLWVADTTQIVSINATTKAVNKITVTGAAGFNDLVTDGARYIYVSDTGQNRIYRIDSTNTAMQTMLVTNAGFNGPNGLLIDNMKLLMVGVGSLMNPNDKANFWTMNLDGTGAAINGTVTGKYDGIQKYGTDFLLSDVFGKTVSRVSASGATSTLIYDFAKVNQTSAADIGLDPMSKILGVPDVLGTQVSFLALP